MLNTRRMFKTLRFPNNVVVELYRTKKRSLPLKDSWYDIYIYTDVNREWIEQDWDSYFDVYEKVGLDWEWGFCNRKEIMQVLRKVKEVTNETL